MNNRLLQAFYGNEKAKATLALGWKGGRLPHAVLLEGESGAGKKTFARLIAAAAVCSGEERPCGVCRHCAKAMEGVHPDIRLIDGGESAKNLNVDAIREIRSSASVRPNEAERKVYILADAQNMTVQAQNALLKVLEEPPKGVVFVLTCENRSALLETILSRVTLVRIENPPPALCEQVLHELAPGHGEEEYRLAADVFDGNIGRAAASLGDAGFRRIVDGADAIAKAAVQGTEYDLLEQLAAFENDKDGFRACLRRVKAVFAGLLRRKYLPEQQRDALDSGISALQCERIVAIIEAALQMMEQNMGYPLASVWLCSQMKSALNR